MMLLRRLRMSLCVAAVVVLACVSAGTPASAHAVLVKATPAADEIVTVAPTQVALQFEEPVATVGRSVIAVIGPDGTTVDEGNTAISGDTVYVALKDLSIVGSYVVTYRVVADDGHILNGSYSFQYQPQSTEQASAGEPSASATPTSASPQATVKPQGTSGWISRILVLGGFAGLYVVTSRWLKAYRRRTVGRDD
jgi:methionine-rich copper-binding protein CopC